MSEGGLPACPREAATATGPLPVQVHHGIGPIPPREQNHTYN